MAWSYAELSKAAKAVGGPEKLFNSIEAGGIAKGRTSMIPWLGVAAAGASLLTAVVIKVADYLKEKQAISQGALDKAKAELIQGIKEYDAAHPEGENEETEVNVQPI